MGGRPVPAPNSRSGHQKMVDRSGAIDHLVSGAWSPPEFVLGQGPTGHLGYARVSTGGQQLEPQLARLLPECSRVYVDRASGAKGRDQRPGLARLLDFARGGDVVIAVKLDRIARSLRELVNVSADLEARGIGLRMIDQPVDTTTPSGRLLFAVIGAIGEFERSLIIERTRDGLANARANGRFGGRPQVMTEDRQRIAAKMLAENPPRSFQAIADALGVSRLSVARWVKAQERAGASRQQHQRVPVPQWGRASLCLPGRSAVVPVLAVVDIGRLPHRPAVLGAILGSVAARAAVLLDQLGLRARDLASHVHGHVFPDPCQ